VPDPEQLKVTPVTRRLGDVRLLPAGRNARFMGNMEFTRLVENLKRDGALTSTPLLRTLPDGGEEVLSGNHRTMAAREAFGEDAEATFLLIDGEVDDGRALALQLAHNAIAGEDDPATLKALYDELEDVDLRAYSGLDDKELELLDEVQPGSLTEANLDFRTFSVMALPSEIERARTVAKDAAAVAKAADVAWWVELDQFEKMLDDLDLVKSASDSASTAIAVALILDVFERHVHELADFYADCEDERRWVPTATAVGLRMPATAARVVAQAVAQMIDRHDIDHPWQALELWAADYLGGA
jgi:hypothetical protein